MVTDNQIARFANLYRGYAFAYGQYEVPKGPVQPGIKNKGKAWTVGDVSNPRPITNAVWRDHLDGTGPGLGIIMLCEDDTCWFAVIDVDDYTVDHVKLCGQIARLNLPLVACRTKSGGAHLYVFFSEAIPAVLVRDRLDEWRAALGLSPKTETFPKQIGRAGDEVGNWINIPYQKAEQTMRYGFTPDGKSCELECFLDLAEKTRVAPEYMGKPYFNPMAEDDFFFEGPPCLQAIHSQGGFVEGTRNEGMFSVGVYLIKRYGDSWAARMDEYNQQMAKLPSVEIAGLIKNLEKKKEKYFYACKRPPLNAVCQRRACLAREYGVGDSGTASAKVEILSVIRYDHPAPDPPLWSFEINGRRVMVDNDTFYSRDLLNKAIMAQAGCVPLHMPPARWLRQLNELVQGADITPMPEDASPTGQLWERVEMYLQQGVNAMSKEEVLTGKVYREDGQAYFRSVDLFSYLEARRVKFKSEQAVWQLLRKHGAEKTVWSFGKKPNVVGCNVWGMPYTANIDDATSGNAPVFGKLDEF